MFFTLNPADGRPVYLQIIDQVRTAIVAGRLRQGDRLPPIRQLAETLRVNRNTVAKSYTELERSGVVEMRVGEGTFVLKAISTLNAEEAERQFAPFVDGLVVQAYHLRIAEDEVVRVVKERIGQFRKERASE